MKLISSSQNNSCFHVIEVYQITIEQRKYKRRENIRVGELLKAFRAVVGILIIVACKSIVLTLVFICVYVFIFIQINISELRNVIFCFILPSTPIRSH